MLSETEMSVATYCIVVTVQWFSAGNDFPEHQNHSTNPIHCRQDVILSRKDKFNIDIDNQPEKVRFCVRKRA